MLTTDRRHAPRTKLDQLAYINIEPDNGGIVLNVSGEGLGFHAIAPVERNGTLRLSLQEQNRKIDIPGELVWTDEVQRTGAVRFTNLTAEARDQILDWTNNSNAVAGARPGFGSTLLRALPGTGSLRFARSFTPAVTWWKSARRLKLSGFARGLAAGFLLSLVAFAIVLFSYGHRREFGESLIRLGKRLTVNDQSEATPRGPVPPSSATVSSPPISRPTIVVEDKPPSVKAPSDHRSTHSEAKPLAQTPVLSRLQHSEALPVRPNSGPDKPHEANLSEVKRPEQNPPLLAAAKPTNLGISPLPMAERPASTAKPDQLDASMHSPLPVATRSLGVSPLSSGSKVEMFFDVGRFKKERLAQGLNNQLTQLGIHATIVPRGHLWTTSYQVLAGPYDNEAAEAQIRNELLSHGYKPLPFERGTRDFAFRSRLMIDRSPLPAGEFTIAWESYIGNAKVKFMKGRDLVATADGKWVKLPAKFSDNAYVYEIHAIGSHPLLELRFAGMDRALVFRNLP